MGQPHSGLDGFASNGSTDEYINAQFPPADAPYSVPFDVAEARALAHDPALVLADEPTGDLDAETGLRILDLLEALTREQGKTLLMVTHDRSTLGRADVVFTLAEGTISEGSGPSLIPTASRTSATGHCPIPEFCSPSAASATSSATRGSPRCPSSAWPSAWRSAWLWTSPTRARCGPSSSPARR